MRDIAFGESGKIKKFPKGKIGLEQKDARTGGNFANESSHLVWLIHLSGSGRGHWQSRCEDNRYAKIAAV